MKFTASSDRDPPATDLRASLESALALVSAPLVIAVSGGRDSMALMHAMAQWAPERVRTVATFDHGTGQHATSAASLVVATARKLGLDVVRERSRRTGTTEAEWRAARWEFLNRVAKAFRTVVATAHTQDDQLETVVMRELRGTGARGLAALAAPSAIVRPWRDLSRARVAAWANETGVEFVDDPTNGSRRFLRARVRHDLLPAIATCDRGFASEMLAIGNRAAQLRREVDALIDGWPLETVRAGVVIVPAQPLLRTTDEGRALLWAACCARIGVALDARGTRTLVRFTTSNRRGATVEIAGGATVTRAGDRSHDYFELRQVAAVAQDTDWQFTGAADALPSRLGTWRWKRVTDLVAPQMAAVDDCGRDESTASHDDPWLIGLPIGAAISVRAWHAGDRIATRGARAGRRVTRYFSEARVPVLDRSGWPVVIVDGALMCVPGLCRSIAAPQRPGWPDSIWYRCEREHD